MTKTALLLVLLATLAACNTVAGVGQDITGAAHSVGNMVGG
ncbi:MAG: entericidin [Paracoccaceae bacterium]|jgi:predicted small secreted protein|nr:entericidin [Paracoccaceae bacterium]